MENTEEFLSDLTAWCLNNVKTDKKLAAKVIREFVLWKWSIRHGKYKGSYWSDRALVQYSEKMRKPAREAIKGLIHDHVVPRAYLTELLLSKATTKNQLRMLKKFCIGCVLAPAENNQLNKAKLKSEMPKDWNGKDVWARYKQAFQKDGITIKEVFWGKKSIKKTSDKLSIKPKKYGQ